MGNKLIIHRIEIADLCRAAGIMNAGQLYDAIGVGRESCYHLWSGRAKMIKLTTLDTLCTLLECRVGDIIKYEEVDEDDIRLEEGDSESNDSLLSLIGLS